jgi:Protein of unknown function (DUF3455)
MKKSQLKSIAALLLCAATTLSALAGTDNRAPEVPDQIAVDSSTNKVHFHGAAIGFQVYTWNGTSWGSAVPDAVLFDDDGNVVATHFGVFDGTRFVGPAWESNSGSEVVGALPPAAVIVDQTAVPWLRLAAVKELTHGPGIFANTTFIQRVNTVGGKAPSVAGTAIGQVARVPYTADYYFYRKSND